MNVVENEVKGFTKNKENNIINVVSNKKMKKIIITKEYFETYFNGRYIITKEEYERYLKFK